MRLYAAVMFPSMLVCVLVLSCVTLYTTGDDSTCVCLHEFARNLTNPLLLSHIPDGSDRILIVEQDGVVWSYDHLVDWDKQNPEKFLDISDRIHVTIQPFDQRGLLGLTLHPQFAENNKLYVYYVIVDNDGLASSILSEIRPLGGLDTEREIMRIHEPLGRENAGQIVFGVDGYLYVFVADGATPEQSPNHAQNMTSFLGKVLRIDVDHVPSSGGQQYSIPPDNPFIGLPDVRPEIYALGLRNSWRCSVDQGNRHTGRGRGRIFCGDVGGSKYEEINMIVKGGNYGWNFLEGPSCINMSYASACTDMARNFTAPSFVYGHPPQGGAAVVGGYIYRGPSYPSLQGQYVFGDFMNGNMSVIKDTQGKWQGRDLPICPASDCPCNARFRGGSHIMSFGEDNAGELYALIVDGLFAGNPIGTVVQLVPPTRHLQVCSASILVRTSGITSAITSFVILILLNSRFL